MFWSSVNKKCLYLQRIVHKLHKVLHCWQMMHVQDIPIFLFSILLFYWEKKTLYEWIKLNHDSRTDSGGSVVTRKWTTWQLYTRIICIKIPIQCNQWFVSTVLFTLDKKYKHVYILTLIYAIVWIHNIHQATHLHPVFTDQHLSQTFQLYTQNHCCRPEETENNIWTDIVLKTLWDVKCGEQSHHAPLEGTRVPASAPHSFLELLTSD